MILGVGKGSVRDYEDDHSRLAQVTLTRVPAANQGRSTPSSHERAAHVINSWFLNRVCHSRLPVVLHLERMSGSH